MPPTKPVFDRLPDAKRRTVLDEAAAEFARVGFAAAKVDDIAARAVISAWCTGIFQSLGRVVLFCG